MWVRFVRDNHGASRFFEWSHVKFMNQMAWLLGAWVILSTLGAMRGKSSEETL